MSSNSFTDYCYKEVSVRNTLPPKTFALEFLNGVTASGVFSMP